MLKRLLISGLAGYGIFLLACGFYLVYVNIPGTGFRYDKEIFSIEVQSLLIGLFVILGGEPMKIISVLWYILGGAFLYSSANLMGKAVAAGNENPTYLLGTMIPVVLCIGLGVFLDKLAKRKGAK